MTLTVRVKNDTDKMSRAIAKTLEDAVVDVTQDVKRVSSAAAPHASGKLEKNRYRLIRDGGRLTGEVSFVAVNDGFDYASWTHTASYNLGAGSKKKQGGKSVFGNGTVPVGRGYLANTLRNNHSGYMKHFEESFSKAIR